MVYASIIHLKRIGSFVYNNIKLVSSFNIYSSFIKLDLGVKFFLR